jgi:hypothetical protein
MRFEEARAAANQPLKSDWIEPWPQLNGMTFNVARDMYDRGRGGRCFLGRRS